MVVQTLEPGADRDYETGENRSDGKHPRVLAPDVQLAQPNQGRYQRAGCDDCDAQCSIFSFGIVRTPVPPLNVFHPTSVEVFVQFLIAQFESGDS